MSTPLSPALQAVSDAVLAVAAQRSVEEVLQQLVHRARELAGARYAALGIPDGADGFRQFLVSGMDDELIAALGPLPRSHGMLGAMLETREPYRTEDIHADPRFKGWWPRRHPDMRSFLGVPILGGEAVLAAFYLTDKLGAPTFSATDQALIEMLAAHAAIAITNARLNERSEELSALSERNRLALELHDVVSQKLFSVVLTAEAAVTQLERDGRAARAGVERVRDLAREALEELRCLILGLRPPDLEQDGLEDALRKEATMLGRIHDVAVEVRADGPLLEREDPREAAVLRIAGEALHNAVRHAAASEILVSLSGTERRLELTVADDGAGFDPDDPALRSRHLGLTSMEERARQIGARVAIDSRRGLGTTVRLELPR